MFSGIVEELGEVTELAQANRTWRLAIKADHVLDGSPVGSSVAVNGVCLTVMERGADRLVFDVGPETLKTTALGSLSAGDPVNLELPARLGAPLGGHLVSGHVDGVGALTSFVRIGESAMVAVSVQDPALERYLIPKGSVAVDGVSLTVARLLNGGFEVMLIPHTLAVTTLGRKSEGARVNLEMDLVGKYLYRFLIDKCSAVGGRSEAGG